jgi:hypothetical protein
LLRIFREDCQRGEPDNYVPVLVSRSALPEDPLGAGHNLQLLNAEYPLTYLHRAHRLEEAAGTFFDRNDRWWIADLYSDGVSPYLSRGGDSIHFSNCISVTLCGIPCCPIISTKHGLAVLFSVFDCGGPKLRLMPTLFIPVSPVTESRKPWTPIRLRTKGSDSVKGR